MPSFQKLQIRLNPSRQECSLDGPLQSLGFLFRYKMEDGGYSRTYFNIGIYGKSVSKRFLSETTLTI
jgi:hypothetical protein